MSLTLSYNLAVNLICLRLQNHTCKLIKNMDKGTDIILYVENFAIQILWFFFFLLSSKHLGETQISWDKINLSQSVEKSPKCQKKCRNFHEIWQNFCHCFLELIKINDTCLSRRLIYIVVYLLLVFKWWFHDTLIDVKKAILCWYMN